SKRARENDDDEGEAYATRDKERKHVKLVMETDEQREKCLSYYHGRRTYLKDIQNTMICDLNTQNQQLQQKSQGSA
ncbi:2889_t:CDS:1, partial [Funneliformis geosporum]